MLFRIWLWSIVVRFGRLRGRFVRFADRLKSSGRDKESRLILAEVDRFDREVESIRRDLESGDFGFWATFLRLRQLSACYVRLRDISTSTLRQILFILFVFVVITKFVVAHYYIPSGSAETTMVVGDHIIGTKYMRFFRSVKRGDYIICDDPLFKYDKNPFRAWWQRNVGFGVLGLPDGPSAWTKRVIAVPGDLIEGRIEDGCPVVYLNDKKLDEPYVNKYPLIQTVRDVGFFPFEVLGSIPLLSSLRRESKTSFYSYDRSVGFAEQPFYVLSDDEVVRDPITYLPVLREPNEADPQDMFGPVEVPEDCYWVMGDNRRNSTDSRFWGFLPGSLIRGHVSRILFSIDTEEAWSIFEFLKHPVDFWLKRVRWGRTLKKVSY